MGRRPITLFTGQWADLLSVEWEDAGMDREFGAPEAVQFLQRLNFDPPAANFDAAFSSGSGSSDSSEPR
jgi:hypothetical protein